MCVIAWAHLQSKRFPFVFINNRDEFAARPTDPVGLHQLAGGRTVLCALDASIANGGGGTWCGMQVGGQFGLVALTNAVRCASTVLGASAFSPQSSSSAGVAPVFNPTTSRGRLVVDALASDDLSPPCDETTRMQFSGFTLVSISLRDACRKQSPASVRIFTNRFGLEWGTEFPPSVHALANSFVNNLGEPKCELLRDLLAEAMADIDHPANRVMPVSQVVDRLEFCLCARPQFEVIPAHIVDQAKPYIGLTEGEKTALGITAEVLDSVWDPEEERRFHANIYQEVPDVAKNKKCKSACQGNEPQAAHLFKTLTQTIIVVETLDESAGKFRVHHRIRNTRTATDHDPWTEHTFDFEV